MRKTRQGKPVADPRGDLTARIGGLLGLGLLALSIGCAQTRWNWRETFALGPANTDEVPLSSDSVAGRIARLDSLRERASSMSAAEATRHAQTLADELAAEPPAPVKVGIVRCLADLPTPRAIDSLAVALRDSDTDVRTEACRALAQIDSPRSMELLSETVAQEHDVDVRLAAVRGLGKYRDPRAIQALGNALDDRDPAVQYVAMQSLERSTGQDLGQDVRRWKEVTANASAVLAGRSRPTSR